MTKFLLVSQSAGEASRCVLHLRGGVGDAAPVLGRFRKPEGAEAFGWRRGPRAVAQAAIELDAGISEFVECACLGRTVALGTPCGKIMNRLICAHGMSYLAPVHHHSACQLACLWRTAPKRAAVAAVTRRCTRRGPPVKIRGRFLSAAAGGLTKSVGPLTPELGRSGAHRSVKTLLSGQNRGLLLSFSGCAVLLKPNTTPERFVE